MKETFWLQEWHADLEFSTKANQPAVPLLELGCGPGWDSKHLSMLGYRSISTDISREALLDCRKCAPHAALLQHNLRDGLPFRDKQFPVIIASLCLHYFEWEQTRQILADIRRCLRDDGMLFCRLNSTEDHNYGASGFSEISPNFYQVCRRTKRFFDRRRLDELFLPNWHYEHLEKKHILMHIKPKVIWELVLRKKSGK